MVLKKRCIMKRSCSVLKVIISIILIIFLISRVILTSLTLHDFFKIFYKFNGSDQLIRIVAVELLQAVDLLLIAIVFFVLSIGIRLLFKDEDKKIFYSKQTNFSDFDFDLVKKIRLIGLLTVNGQITRIPNYPIHQKQSNNQTI